eukprot:SAG11_NODE_10839_length_802_cov_1.473684_1_plen_76_part_00
MALFFGLATKSHTNMSLAFWYSVAEGPSKKAEPAESEAATEEADSAVAVSSISNTSPCCDSGRQSMLPTIVITDF